MIRAYLNKRTLIYCLELIVLVTMLVLLLVTFFAVCATLYKCFKYELNIHRVGLVFFIKQFDDIKELIAGTIGIIALFFIIERINLMGEANYSTAREAWKKEFCKTIEEIRIDNPYMAIYFEQISDQLYRYLLKRNFIIYNKVMLRYFFSKYIADQVIEFEKNSKNSIVQEGLYPNRDELFSIEEAKKIIGFIFRLSHYYRTLIDDFENLYRSKVIIFAVKNIKK